MTVIDINNYNIVLTVDEVYSFTPSVDTTLQNVSNGTLKYQFDRLNGIWGNLNSDVAIAIPSNKTIYFDSRRQNTRLARTDI